MHEIIIYKSKANGNIRDTASQKVHAPKQQSTPYKTPIHVAYLFDSNSYTSECSNLQNKSSRKQRQQEQR